MTCDASDEQGPATAAELEHVADHERDVYLAGYQCLLKVLTGDNHQWDHVADLREVAQQIDEDVRMQLERGRRESLSSPLPRGGTSDYPSVATAQIYGTSASGRALECYGTTLATIRALLTQARAGESTQREATTLIRGQLDHCARELGAIAEWGMRVERERAMLRGEQDV